MDVGMEAVNAALEEFEQTHDGHNVTVTTPANREFDWIDYACHECSVMYRAYSTESKRPNIST